MDWQQFTEHIKALHSTTEYTFANHLVVAVHTHKHQKKKIEILHLHAKAQKLDILDQLETHKHLRENNILIEQAQFKSQILFKHTT